MTAPPAFEAARVRGVVFDLDGTLVDGYAGITSGVNAARAAFDLPPLKEDDVRGRVGLGLSHLMEDVVGPERAIEGAAIFRQVYDHVCEEQTRPAPALHRTLSALGRRGLRMSVASNKPASFSVRILERLGVRSFFDAIEGPETAGALKPEPAMIRACLRAMKVGNDEALYVGDMAIDAEAGARAGVAVVLVSGGSTSRAGLIATGCPVIGALADLLGTFGIAAPPVS
jgi:HAD superfamily hydrolase (TIGR01509 family)